MTPEGFSRACDDLAKRCEQAGWNEVKVERADNFLLIIKRRLGGAESEEHGLIVGVGVVDEEDEDDDCVIYSRPCSTSAVNVVYTIALSPTYQVPVLYFQLNDLPTPGPRGIDAVYKYLVPLQWKRSLQSTGVLGGISMTNHPCTGVPCFFVHPCNTADAMAECIGSRTVSDLEYLVAWFGLTGACVGLFLPKEVVIDDSLR